MTEEELKKQRAEEERERMRENQEADECHEWENIACQCGQNSVYMFI